MANKPEKQSSPKPRAFEPDPELARFKRIAIVGFFILLIGIIAVVVFLPAQLAKNKEQEQNLSKAESAAGHGIVDKEYEAKAKAAEEALNTILNLQARLENDGIKVWGAEKLAKSYGDLLTLLAQANESFDDLLYDQALKGYQEVIKQLEQLEASRPERAERAMQKGDEAFAQLNGALAAEQYTIAVAADPGNSKAQTGLQRAEKLPQVLNLVAEGERYENKGELVLARQKYGEAIALDKEFQPAQDLFHRLDADIADSEILKFMTEAESAFQQEDITQARAALKNAQNIKPDASGVQDLEQQLNNLALYSDIQALGQKALQYEMAEEWSSAVEIYNSILTIDANTVFAQEGKKRVENILTINKQMKEYLLNPDHLQEPEHIDHARALYELAVAQSDGGPQFDAQAEQLNSLLAEYGKPVPVLVQSDNLTDVTVYHVERLGQFSERRLTLLPGSYKAVGSRSGYRDVSVLFTVPVGSEEVIINVACEEKI